MMVWGPYERQGLVHAKGGQPRPLRPWGAPSFFFGGGVNPKGAREVAFPAAAGLLEHASAQIARDSESTEAARRDA
eukprot:6684754-Lingulodinium_polyedra.AAC.1